MIQFQDSRLPDYHIKRWGTAGWRFMTACALAFPMDPSAKQQTQMRQFLHSWAPVLPCATCRVHFRIAVANMPREALNSRLNLLTWVHSVQNDIRARKQQPKVTFDDFIQSCTNYQQRCICTWKEAFGILLVLWLITLFCVLLSRGSKR